MHPSTHHDAQFGFEVERAEARGAVIEVLLDAGSAFVGQFPVKEVMQTPDHGAAVTVEKVEVSVEQIRVEPVWVGRLDGIGSHEGARV